MKRPDQIVLAIDFGLRRIGIATGNLLTGTASPLKTLTIGSDVPWPALDEIVADWRPDRIVLGRPDSAAAASMSERIDEFAAEIERRYGLPIELVDEALTSRAAESELRDARRSGVKTRRLDKGSIDRRAACLIAEQWMQEAGHGR